MRFELIFKHTGKKSPLEEDIRDNFSEVLYSELINKHRFEALNPIHWFHLFLTMRLPETQPRLPPARVGEEKLKLAKNKNLVDMWALYNYCVVEVVMDVDCRLLAPIDCLVRLRVYRCEVTRIQAATARYMDMARLIETIF